VLQERFPDTVANQPELLAYHFTQAGLAAPAISYWHRAGKRAGERSANVEAIAHLRQGLSLVPALPDTKRLAEELALQIAIGGPLTAIKGYSSQEVERTYLRARELAEQLGRSRELFPVLRGLWNCYYARGEFLRGHDLAERLVKLAEEEEPLRCALARRALGSTLFFLGRFSEARGQLDQAIAFDEAAAASENRRAHVVLYADSPGVIGRLHLSCIEWLIGFPDRALETLNAGLALGEVLAHAQFLSLALSFASIVHQWRGEFEVARRRAEKAIAAARQHGLAARLAVGTICRGAALAHLGQYQEGIAELHAGFACWHGTGARLYDTMWLGFTAEAHAAVGQFDAAFAALDRATEMAAATAEFFYQAELHRLRGALHQKKGDSTEAQHWLNEAINFAHGQASRSLELRAAMSMARLWSDQGKQQQARDLLAPVYGWFTEGFDTLDLKQAKTLLDELAS
jgi:predicted ATPase